MAIPMSFNKAESKLARAAVEGRMLTCGALILPRSSFDRVGAFLASQGFAATDRGFTRDEDGVTVLADVQSGYVKTAVVS